MVEKVFRTDDLPAGDRFDAWCELVGRTHAPVEISSEHRNDFHAWQRVMRLGPAVLWPTAFRPQVFRRTTRLVRRSDPETVHLSLPGQGAALGLSQHGRESVCGAGDLLVVDSSRPWQVWTAGSGPMHYGVGLEIPKAALPLPRGLIDQVAGRRLPGGEGVGSLLAALLTQAVSPATTLHESDGARLGGVLTDLLAAVFAHHAQAGDVLPEASRRRSLLLNIQAFIQQNLGDPELTPVTVAAAHHVSLRSLHRLFQSEGTSIALYIRCRRLERVCRDLADPAQRALPVCAIAARWGFSRAADFSRTFRAAFGVTPTEYREAALATTRGAQR